MKPAREQSAEDALFSQGIFEALPDAVFVFAADGLILYANGGAEDHYGYTAEELKSMKAADLAASDLRDQIPPYLSATSQTRDRFQWRYRCKDHSELPVEIIARPISYHGQTAIFANVRILNEQNNHDKELIESERRYRDLFEYMPSGFVLFGVVENDKGEPVDLEIVAANEQFAQTTGVSLDDAVGNRLTQVVPGIERDSADWLGTYTQVALSGQTRKFEDDSELLGKCYYVTAYQAGPGQCAVHFTDITQQKRALDEIREKENFISGILGSVSDGVFALDNSLHFTFANDIFIQSIGKSREEVLGKLVWDLFPETMVSELAKFYQRALAERIAVDYEVYFSTLQQWVAARIYPTADGGLMVYAKDVTRRHRMEETIRETQTRLQLATEEAGVAVWEYDFNSNSMTRSDNHDRLYGLERQQKWDINTFLNATHPADRELSNEMIQSSVAPDGADHYRFEFRVVYPDSSIHWLLVTGTVVERNLQGQGVIVRGSLIDVTKLKEAQEMLAESESRFRALFEQAGVGVAQVELESGKFIRINQKYCDILGYSEEEAKRIDFHSITHLDDVSLGREIVEELKSGKIRHASLEKRCIRKDGSSVWVNLTTAAMWAPGEAPRFVVTVAEDISERKKAEFELKKFAMLTDSSSDFVGMCDLDMNPIYVNAAGLRMVGLPDMAAACRVKVRDYFFPEDQSFIDEVFFPKVLREGHGAKEMRLRHFQTGKSIWVVYTLFSVLDESGKAVGWATVSRDISKRRLDAKRIRQGFVATIATIAKIVEVRDPYTSGHQDRVSQLSIAIAEEMRLGKDRIEGIGIGAKIHDIGKIQIPAEILSKPGKLSSTEYGLIQSHPETGFAILKDIDFPWPVAEIAHQHHERIDGSGYPQGLKGDEILLEARIVAVADVIEAMSSHRPYRPAVGVDVALEEIKAHRGTKYDAAVVDVCLRLFAEKRFLFDPVS